MELRVTGKPEGSSACVVCIAASWIRLGWQFSPRLAGLPRVWTLLHEPFLRYTHFPSVLNLSGESACWSLPWSTCRSGSNYLQPATLFVVPAVASLVPFSFQTASWSKCQLADYLWEYAFIWYLAQGTGSEYPSYQVHAVFGSGFMP
ncbi:unnamed protein product [Victoria cruziana]